MTPDTIAILAQIAEAVLTALAIALGFYVRSTVTSKSTADCAALELKLNAKVEAAETALENKIAAIDAALEAKIENSIGRMYERVGAYEPRIRNLEIRIDGNAKSEDLHRVALQLAEMGGDIKGMIARMDAMEMVSKSNAGSLRRLEDHVLEVQK